MRKQRRCCAVFGKQPIGVIMSEYKYVQFIGYAVSTKPALCGPENSPDYGNRKYYLGDAQDGRDMEYRLKLMGEALQKAQAACDRRPGVLKIFVAPEFFFRGAYGAYYGQDAEERLRQGLGELYAAHGPDMGMALWGSSLLAEQAADFTRPEIAAASVLGDEYLHLYETCREFRTAIGKETPGLRDILFGLDELENPATRPDDVKLDPLAAVLEQILHGCTRKAPVKVSNTCQIMLAGDRYLTVRKQFKSCVDFILNYSHGQTGGPDNRGSYMQTFVAYPDIAPAEAEMKREDRDPYSIFDWRGLKVGVEICLDHIRQRLSGRVNDLDLQIIPSCGAEVTKGCIAARAGGYVFNCDGDYTLDDAQNGDGAHTQLFRVEAGGDPARKLDAALGQRIAPQEIISLDQRDVARYFPAGAGEVHVYGPQALAD